MATLPESQYIVVVSRPWMNETGHGWDHYSDMKRFEDRSQAISHGFTLGESDDFGIGTLRGDALVAMGWMHDDFPTDDAGIPAIAKALYLKSGAS